MTLEDIKALNKPFLVPKDVAPYLGVDPYSINVQAKQDASKLGFPVIMIGSRVKIPKDAFIRFITGESA